MHRGEKWDRNNFDVNNIFAFQVALDIIQNDDDPEPQNTNECRQRNDWPKWREAMQAELHSLIKRDVFGPVVQTPTSVKLVGNKWVFVRKRNENNDIIRYKARLVAQGVTPRSRGSVDYPSTCGNSICLVSRDSYLSKNASWAHKPILIKTNITTILQLSPNNSIVDYTFIQTYIKIYNSKTCYVQKPSKPQTGFFKISL